MIEKEVGKNGKDGFWDVLRDVWGGEQDLCLEITLAMKALKAAGLEGALGKHKKAKKIKLK